MREFIVYNRIKLRDCLRLPDSWGKIAWYSYTKYRRKAEKENPPGHNVLMTGILQTIVSKNKSFMDEAVKLVKENVPEDTILCLTGAALCDIGYYEEGLERLRKAVAIEPSLENMVVLAGYIEKPEDYAEKLELSNRILQKNPDDTDGLRHKAFVLVEYGQLDEAEELLRKALDVSPKNRANKEALGEIMFRRGSYKEALQLYKKAYSFLDKSKYSWQQIALCYSELGKPKKAKKAAYRLLKLAKQDGDDLNTPSKKALFGKFGIAL